MSFPSLPSLSLLLPLLTFACADLTAPSGTGQLAADEPRPASAASAEAQAAKKGAPGTERITASHILIAYEGATRASPEIKRTKEQAQALAQSLAARAKKGEDFAKLATENSDDPSAKRNRGSLGSFDSHSMVKSFSEAAFALKPGEVSDVVETGFGFHVIKREQ